MTITEIIAKREAAAEALAAANDALDTLLNSRQGISTQDVSELEYQQESMARAHEKSYEHITDFRNINTALFRKEKQQEEVVLRDVQ